MLRKCKVLASRLRHAPLKEWTEWELTGYPSEEALPDYRKLIGAVVLGNFSGAFGSGLNNAPIPQFSILEEHREWLFHVSFLQGVAELEELAQMGDGGLRFPWPADLVAFYGQKIYENMNCLSANRVVSTSVVTGILDTVRTRVLSFALEIEEASPDAGEDGPANVSTAKVNQIFNTYIYGGQANVAGAAGDVTQTTTTLPAAWPALREELLSLGVAETDMDQLGEAISADGEDGDPFGERTQGWIGKMAGRLTTGAVTLATGTSADVLAGVILRHLGG